MVYLEKIKIKGKEYYKLVHAERKNSKVTHRSMYLGRILPSNKRLEQLKKEFLREIRDGRFKYLAQNDIEKIESKRKIYNQKIKKITKTEREKNLKEFIIRFTYDSNKLAGVKASLRQTYLILKEEIIPENIKDTKTIKEIENHERGVIAITEYKGPLNIRFIKKLHKILLSGVDDSIAGKLRSELKRDVKLAGTTHMPPKWHQLDRELNNFFRWYKSECRRLYVLELAALIHLKLITMQPFVDGNSRLSRLLMNWVFWKRDYPMVDIPVEDLENYYDALDKYQIEKKEKPFVDYIKKRYLEEKI